ncbi:MAG: glutamine--fructose-6-phosphate transaminase (isomerizing) [Candidatus Rickettsia vulgarisii]
MCGIVAGISRTNILLPLISGLEKLEYRGYDSAGMALIINDQIAISKTIGKVADLKKILPETGLSSTIGISHTRWATHGKPSVENAHPHVTERVAIVHNGIIENYKEIKKELLDLGYKFKSATDTEVVANLLDYYLSLDMDHLTASNKTLDRLEGSYALVFMFKDNPILFAANKTNSLVIGISDDGHYIASDAIAFDYKVQNIIYLDDGDRAIIKQDVYQIFDVNNNITTRSINKFSAAQTVSKENYPHFMLKEIYEQPLVLTHVLNKYVKGHDLNNLKIDWKKINKIKIVACGSAYYSGYVAKYWIEEISNIAVDIEIASEYRYRKSADKDTQVTIIVSQSGETIDTLEALKKAKSQGQIIISIINAERSSIARASDYVLPIMTGPEVGVASTKAFLGQVMVFAALSLKMGLDKGHISKEQFHDFSNQLLSVPEKLKTILDNHDNIKNIANELKDFKNCFFIARGALYPIALEGSLKLKELSYIHAEGYAAGELKHGPISLLDKDMLVISLLHSNILFEKVFSNLQEILARDPKTLCMVDKHNVKKIPDNCNWIYEIVDCDEFIAPIIYTLPLQLLAYYTADAKENNIDQPRNLAKSVTVE